MKYSYAQLEEIWIHANPKQAAQAPLMASIALAESAGDPRAKNASGATGLWQILGNPFPGNAENPVTNAKMAGSKLSSQGLGAWETYTNGAYKTYFTESNIKEAAGKIKTAGEVEIIPGESKVPLLGPLGEGAQELGELPGKALGEAAEEAAKETGEAIVGKGGTEFLESLGEPETWLRIAEGLGGLLLLYIALKQLSGRFEVSRTAVSQARLGSNITVRAHKSLYKQSKTVGTEAVATASAAAKVPARAKAAKKAHVRSIKFGGTKAQARKAAVTAARKPGK
ncbi:MAG TPA: transglycosylase SLT domain-containing protein [Candidatus Saccharimonadales bacterium]|jgi:hypothetical protein